MEPNKEILESTIRNLEEKKSSIQKTVKKTKSLLNQKRKDEIYILDEEIEKCKNLLSKFAEPKIIKEKKTEKPNCDESDLEPLTPIYEYIEKKKKAKQKKQDELLNFLEAEQKEKDEKRKPKISIKKIENQENLNKFLLSLHKK